MSRGNLQFIILFEGTVALVLTMSRVALLVWVIVLLGILVSRVSKVVFVSIVLSILLCLILTPLGSRFLQTSFAEEAVAQRIVLTTQSWQLFSQQPLWAIGWGNFLPSLASLPTSSFLGLYLQPVHNIFWLVLVEVGVVGGVLFGVFLFNTYRKLLSSNSPLFPKVFGLLLTEICILGFVDHYFLTLQQGQLLLALVLGLCWVKLKK